MSENISPEVRITELKVKMFDIMREQTVLQNRVNVLEQEKQTLFQELQKLEQKI